MITIPLFYVLVHIKKDMILKIKDPVVGLIDNDTTLSSVFIIRNGKKNFFQTVDGIYQINIYDIESIYALSDILKFNISEKSSIVIDLVTTSFVVTAEDGTQASYPYTLDITTPYNEVVPNVLSILDSSGTDVLISDKVRKELLGSYSNTFNINVIDAIASVDYQNLVFSGNVFVEFQDVNTNSPNIDANLSEFLKVSGFAYYIVGFGDGQGVSDWASYPDWNNNFLFFRVIEDATFFNTETVSKIKIDELGKRYYLLQPNTLILLDDNIEQAQTILEPLYQDPNVVVDSTMIQTELTNNSIPFLIYGTDVLPTDVEKIENDLSISQCKALNAAESFEIFTYEDLYDLDKTIAQKLNTSEIATKYPYVSQWFKSIVSGESAYVPQYDTVTRTQMVVQVEDYAKLELSKSNFWLKEVGLVGLKFVRDRYKFVSDNYDFFDYGISKVRVDDVVKAFDDLIAHYYRFNLVTTTLTPQTFDLLSHFTTILINSKNVLV